ncbi:hypothetical protein VT50_0218265 [Streptomyces antioxidans]|uniref:HIG1 domain-containing protein n=1 Tax=Streptomyces antioxidans TaxID=1507734 RepID=A0A1V4D3Q4_9ACTN|nr:hypothetical protein [Streptomyces antioxidans]OPF78705.1 hypothetical protein VT50_0218265 [Streptomyces antioxidans]
MTPVQVNWLSIVLGPIAVIALLSAFSAQRSAVKRGESMPGWGKAVQGVGIVFVLFVALSNMMWGT